MMPSINPWIEPATFERDYPDLFDRLDLALPQMSDVANAVRQGNRPAAEKAVGDYYRKQVPRRFFERPFPGHSAHWLQTHAQTADRMLRHELYDTQFDEWLDLGSKINWQLDPSALREHHTYEYISMLNRLPWLPAMANAYQQENDERYVHKIVQQMIDWTRTWPRPADASTWSNFHDDGETEQQYMNRFGWNTLCPADQCLYNWTPTLAQIITSPAICDQSLCAIVWSFSEKAFFLDQLPPRPGNKGAREQAGLHVVATLFSEFKSAPGWRSRAIKRLYQQMSREYYPDGMHDCLCIGYTLKMIGAYLHVFDLARHNQQSSEIPEDFTNLMQTMFEYQGYAMMSDGMIPGLSDSTDTQSIIEWGAQLFPERKDFQWFASKGEQGQHPKQTSFAFAYGGHYVMRSGYDRDARYLLFDGGLLGSSHSHPDKLTAVIAAYGKKLLIDAGNYWYDDSPWRRYCTSTRGHNTIRVDRQDQHHHTTTLTKPYRPLDNEWSCNDSFDYVRAKHTEGYGDADAVIHVTHTRAILFVKPDFWIVVDSLVPNDDAEHDYELLWHLNVESVTMDTATGQLLSQDRDEPNVQIWIASQSPWVGNIVRGREQEPIQGWACDPWRAVPTAVYQCRAVGRVRIATVFYPLAPGQKPRVQAVTCCAVIDSDGHVIDDAIGIDVRMVDATSHEHFEINL